MCTACGKKCINHILGAKAKCVPAGHYVFAYLRMYIRTPVFRESTEATLHVPNVPFALKNTSHSLTLAAWLSFQDVKHDDHHYGDGHDEDGGHGDDKGCC